MPSRRVFSNSPFVVVPCTHPALPVLNPNPGRSSLSTLLFDSLHPPNCNSTQYEPSIQRKLFGLILVLFEILLLNRRFLLLVSRRPTLTPHRRFRAISIVHSISLCRFRTCAFAFLFLTGSINLSSPLLCLSSLLSSASNCLVFRFRFCWLPLSLVSVCI